MAEIVLKDGRLEVAGFTAERMSKLYYKLREDLLDSKIPHYRPVMFKITQGGRARESRVIKLPGFGYSYSELSFILDSLIVNKRYGVGDEDLQQTTASAIISKESSFIALMGCDVGSAFPGSIFAAGEGISSKVEMLLNDAEFFRNLNTGVVITVVLRKGIGFRDFNDNETGMLKTDTYKAMRTSYSLYPYFIVERYTGNGAIKFNYKRNINETVLCSILQDYINSKEVLGDV